jgi:hypothetical protein
MAVAEKQVTYRGYKIAFNDSPLGACFLVTRPGADIYTIGTWSMEQAKRAVRADIKQSKCDHAAHPERVSKDGKWRYCCGCDRSMGRVENA